MATPKFSHLRIDQKATATPYTSPKPGRDKFKMPPRDRAGHGKRLLDVLENLDRATKEQAAQKSLQGTVLVFRSSENWKLRLQSLESVQAGIELLSVREEAGVQYATVFVPTGKLAYFKRLFQAYLTGDTRTKQPKNKKLVDSIEDVALAALENLWTDDGPFPPLDQKVAWEVWLRTGTDADAQVNFFRTDAAALGLTVGARTIRFPDRVVLLVEGTARQLGSSLSILDVLAEVRLAKICRTEFLDNIAAHKPWVESFLKNLTPPNANALALCLLDVGVHAAHPLIRPALHDDDVLTCFPPAPAVDHRHHGTEMAGLMLYGDLAAIAPDGVTLTLEHRLESVQILPRGKDNHPDVYGAITLEAVNRAIAQAPNRERLFCMAVTSNDARDRGRPSSWSAEIDQMSFGNPDIDDPRKLFFVSAGNLDRELRWQEYPSVNHLESIQDPGQSWNAVTVGAHTEKVVVTSSTFDGYEPLAPRGGLCPNSTTSVAWENDWPFKPDLVMEGGNAAYQPAGSTADCLEDLQLLTTRLVQGGRLFSAVGDTSAATALAARMAAQIQVRYPAYWPETIRALMVHSAEWNDAMLAEFEGVSTKKRVRNRLRTFGYGVPNLERALWCASNALTLVSQAEIQPYHKVSSGIKTKHMHLYDIPWPTEALLSHGDANVRMRVTLSYFIEPSPGRRGWKNRHRYPSHGLRFDVKKPTESLPEFKVRMNKQAEEEAEIDGSDSRNWALGVPLRNRGCLISDWWEGSAAELAACGHIGVVPIIGWWRERPQFLRYERAVRYSLIISLMTEATEVDIYTPVANQLAVPVETEIG